MTAMLNRVQLIGNIGDEPKPITTKSGHVFVTASLATNESVKRNDQWESMVEWHQLIFFGSMRKITGHLSKGSPVYIEGKLRNSSWTDANGTIHRTTNIMVSNVQLLGSSKAKEDQATEPTSPHAAAHLAEMQTMLAGSDVPF